MTKHVGKRNGAMAEGRPIIMSGIHVLLVSLFGRPIVQSILIFFFAQPTDQPTNQSQRPEKTFGPSLNFCLVSLCIIGEQKKERLTKKNSESYQKLFVRSLILDNFFLVDQKNPKWTRRRLTKSTWAPL